MTKFFGFIFAALLLLAPAVPASANAFAKSQEECKRLWKDPNPKLTCGMNPGPARPLRELFRPFNRTESKLKEVRAANGDNSISWETTLPSGSYYAISRRTTS